MSLLPLTVTDLTVVRHGRAILGPVSLTLGTDGMTVILGPNGAGKTTLLRAIHGVERISGGRVDWSVPGPVARGRQALVFQTPIVMRRSILDNIAFPLVLRGRPRKAARREAADWAARVGLGDDPERPARVLSGGERQKMALARALIIEPDIVFLDEPTANLDGRSMAEIEAILTAARDRGVRLVLATHNLGQARRLGTEIVFLHQGRIAETAPAAAFFAGPSTEVARGYLRGDLLT